MALLLLTGCKDDDCLVSPAPAAATVTVNVDVVLPQGIQQQWQNTTDWALENIAKAQQKQRQRVALNLRFHDEDTENLDSLAYRLAHPVAGDDTCHVIIGPYHSDHAQTFLSHAAAVHLPVIMPTCTSAELQRINARNTHAWFLTESDITQCEIMMNAAHMTGTSDVALVYSDDTYGRSFAEWFGYYAAEHELHVAGGITTYEKGDNLLPFMQSVTQAAVGRDIRVFVALSDPTDYRPVCDQIFPLSFLCDSLYFRTICADSFYNLTTLSDNDFMSFGMGITPAPSQRFGFSQSYAGRFLRTPLNGDSQLYDALTLIALGAALRLASPDKCVIDDKEVPDADLNDYMRSLTASIMGLETQWNVTGLALAFNELAAGRPIFLTGATGSLMFDEDTHTKVLNTTYMLWKINPKALFSDTDPYYRVQPVIYLSTQGADGEASTTSIWQLEKRLEQTFDTSAKSNVLPPVSDHWAVVVSPSTTWGNYRHQADAFAMYQLLRQYGYDDEHIILIVEDNLADDPKNEFPGQIFIERSSDPDAWGMLLNEDVRRNAVIDYHFSQLHPSDIGDILMGRQSARLPHVIHPDSTSNIFLFWSGHGGSQDGPLWGNEDAKTYFGTERIHNIVTQMNAANHYRRMMLAVETCYSGKWGEALTQLPDVLVLTAANPNETSKADVFDQQLGVYLSNAFSRTFRSKVGSWSGITLYDLYRDLYKTTTGSHVTIYNHQQYGSVYTETMNDFFPTTDRQ